MAHGPRDPTSIIELKHNKLIFKGFKSNKTIQLIFEILKDPNKNRKSGNYPNQVERTVEIDRAIGTIYKPSLVVFRYRLSRVEKRGQEEVRDAVEESGCGQEGETGTRSGYQGSKAAFFFFYVTLQSTPLSLSLSLEFLYLYHCLLLIIGFWSFANYLMFLAFYFCLNEERRSFFRV